jgi:hypothetical protein
MKEERKTLEQRERLHHSASDVLAMAILRL